MKEHKELGEEIFFQLEVKAVVVVSVEVWLALLVIIQCFGSMHSEWEAVEAEVSIFSEEEEVEWELYLWMFIFLVQAHLPVESAAS